MEALFDHISLTVADVGRSIAFYGRHFGFELKRRDAINRGPHVDALTGVKDSAVEAVFVSNGALTLEFVGFETPKGSAKCAPMNDAGSPHLGFIVKDVKEVYRRLSAEGVEFVGAPVVNPHRGTTSAMLRDPDGIHIELRESPALQKGS